MDKPAALRAQTSLAETELLEQLKAAAENASQGVVIAHRIDELRTLIDRNRATIRRLDNAADVVGRRSAGNRRLATERRN